MFAGGNGADPVVFRGSCRGSVIVDRAESPYFVLSGAAFGNKMELEDSLHSVIEEEIESMGFELIKADFHPMGRRGVLQIYIDHPGRVISMSDCILVSKTLGVVLDGMSEFGNPYNLEVSSPGENRPLTKPEHFERFKGETARVRYVDGTGAKKSVMGPILGSDGNDVAIAEGDKEIKIAFSGITEANLMGKKPGKKKAGSGQGRKNKRRRKRR